MYESETFRRTARAGEDMYLSIAVARAIVDELIRQGIPVETACARTALVPIELADAGARLPIDRVRHIIGAAVALSTTPALGLRVGESAPIGTCTLIGHLLTSAGSARDAIGLLVRYSALISEGAAFQLIEHGGDARLVYVHRISESRYERFASECALSFALRRIIQISGADNRPVGARFRHAAPAYLDEYERIFRCPVAFEQPANELVFARELLDQPQLHRDDALCDLLQQRAEQQLAHAFTDERLGGRVVELLKRQLPATDLERLALELGVPLRSLQRRLRERGLSLSRLHDEARRDVACATLRRPEVPIKDVAFGIGFSEPSAFYRAFKRWTGRTPAQFREDCARA
jgi:AraC-like DNA-binding protein